MVLRAILNDGNIAIFLYKIVMVNVRSYIFRQQKNTTVHLIWE